MDITINIKSMIIAVYNIKNPITEICNPYQVGFDTAQCPHGQLTKLSLKVFSFLSHFQKWELYEYSAKKAIFISFCRNNNKWNLSKSIHLSISLEPVFLSLRPLWSLIISLWESWRRISVVEKVIFFESVTSLWAFDRSFRCFGPPPVCHNFIKCFYNLIPLNSLDILYATFPWSNKPSRRPF